MGKIGTIKAPKLPAGEWNRYGGLLKYEAHPAVLPDRPRRISKGNPGCRSSRMTVGLIRQALTTKNIRFRHRRR